MLKRKPTTDSSHPVLHAKFLLVLACILTSALCTTIAYADSVSAGANTRLTDGAAASSSTTDAAWVVFDKDSAQLPAALGTSPNLGTEFLGTNEYKGSGTDDEISMETNLRSAGSRAYRATIYTQVFSDPSSFNWDWFEGYPDGERIRRAINAGQMVNITVNKIPFWANKDLSLEAPPTGTVIQEQVTLNGTGSSQLAHKFLMGEKYEWYYKVSVVDNGDSTPYQYVDNEVVGVGTGAGWQELTLAHSPTKPGKVKIFVNGTLWSEVPYFASDSGNSQTYVFFPNTGKIRFGDGGLGPKLPAGATVTAQYSYYTKPYKEYNGGTYNTIDQLDYRIDYANGTIRRTANSTIPSGATVRVTYYYLDTSWWQDFWKGLTSHYSGQVKYFEVWNEENLSKFFWGTAAQYAELLRTAYNGAKQGNSSAMVVLGGFGADTDYLSQLYALGAKNNFDVLAWHPYGWNVGPDNPSSQFNVMTNVYSAAASANGDASKPVFMNEMGFSGMAWGDQAIALSRAYMLLLRNPQVANMSWWGIIDDSPIGVNESDLYVAHLGMFASDASGNVQTKPAFYTFKNLGTNKGVIIDLAKYDAGGNVTQWSFDVNKIIFSSLGDDLSAVKISYSSNNVNDWQQVSAITSNGRNSRGTQDYVVSFPTIHTRFVQVQFVKKSNVSSFAIDEIQVVSLDGKNAAYKKLYAAAGFKQGSQTASSSPNPPSSGGSSTTAPSTPPASGSSSGGSSGGDSGGDSSGGGGGGGGGSSGGGGVTNFSGGGGGGGGALSIVCKADDKCSDNNPCTVDTCQSPGTYNSKCLHTQVPQCTEEAKKLVLRVPVSIQEGAEFTVVVLDGLGNPVNNVKVTYDGSVVVTDSNGVAGFGAAKTDGLITAQKQEFTESNATIYIEKPKARDTNLMLSVPDGVRQGDNFTVTVHNSDGKAVGGAVVEYGGQQKVSDANGNASFVAQKSGLFVFASNAGVEGKASLVVEQPQNPSWAFYLGVAALIALIAAFTFMNSKTKPPGQPDLNKTPIQETG